MDRLQSYKETLSQKTTKRKKEKKNFERAKISSNSLIFTQGGIGSHFWVPTAQLIECLPTSHEALDQVDDQHAEGKATIITNRQYR